MFAVGEGEEGQQREMMRAWNLLKQWKGNVGEGEVQVTEMVWQWMHDLRDRCPYCGVGETEAAESICLVGHTQGSDGMELVGVGSECRDAEEGKRRHPGTRGRGCMARACGLDELRAEQGLLDRDACVVDDLGVLPSAPNNDGLSQRHGAGYFPRPPTLFTLCSFVGPSSLSSLL